VQTFIDEINSFQPAVLGLSGFLTLAFDSMKETIEAIKHAGLRNNVKIMIGGGQIDDAVRVYTGADAFGTNAIEAVSLCKGWLGATA
jgi:5-methyltetrahydrofolate--homocysteine methyltransferase